MSERTSYFPAKGWSGFKGYSADATNAPFNFLAPPSVNAMIDENGVAETRMGFEDTGWDLGQAGKPATSYYMEKYDITFFALGTKVLYVDHNNSNAVVDTGLTLTTGTTTRFDEFEGDLYLTNTTDGMRRIIVMRLNDASATSGDANVTVDRDGAARISVFGLSGSGNLRINGTNEAYNAVAISTGVITLVGTLSQTYANNTIAIRVHDISGVTGIEKASKVFFFKRRLGMLGSEIADNSDQPNNTIYYGKFTAPTTMEDIIVFDYATGGSTREMVGNRGRVTNAIPMQDFLCQLTTVESYVTAASDVQTSGASLGATPPDLRDPFHGCINEDCAVDMGDNEMTAVATNKRIMRYKVSSNSVTANLFPDESFDVPMRKILRLMDEDQTGALVYRHSGKRRTYYQLKIDGTWVTLCYDKNIEWSDDMGNVRKGAWQPPQIGKAFKSAFERKGVLYATDMTDDTVYKVDSTLNDNGVSIQCYIYSAEIDVDESMVDEVECKGIITANTTAYVRTPVNGADLSGVAPKAIVGADYSYGSGTSPGSVPLGSSALAGNSESTDDFAQWKKRFDVFPSEANRVQFGVSCFGDSYHVGLKKFRLKLRQFSNSFTKIT